MARTTVKVAPAASRVLRKSAIVASLCAVMLVAGMLHPTYAYGDTLSDAKAALTAAQKELTAAKNELTAAEKELTAAKSALTTVQNNLNATGITEDVVIPGKTPLYVPVSGNTGKPANSTLVAVEGKYVDGTSDSTPRTQQKILEYINSVRQDAYNTKLANGDRVVSSYKKITWSSNLERTAQVRATEISIYGDHTRPSGEAWYGVSDEGLMQGSAENLSWGASYYNNIKMWVDEKADYIKYLNCSKGIKTVNGVNQCSYGVYGHYRNLVNPQYDKVGLAQFNSDRATINPYTTAMAAEFSASANTQSSDVKAVNTTVYQGVYVKTAAMGSVGTAGATTFSPSKISGDPVWTRNAQVKEAKALAVSLGYKTTTTADVTAAQNKVNAAQSKVNAAQAKVTAAQNKVNNALDKYIAAGGTSAMSGMSPNVTRLAGSNAFGTMQAIVGAGSFGTGGTVVISTYSGFHDALAASGIAGLYNAPILFTKSNQLSNQTKTELEKLKPTKVIITGGTVAISSTVETDIKSYVKSVTGKNPAVTRCAGSNAAGTAEQVALKPVREDSKKWNASGIAIVVTDKSYHDALAMGPYAYAKHVPIFYARGGTKIESSTLAAMKTLGIKEVHIAGGEAAVSKNVENILKQQVGEKNVYRHSGKNAIATSQAVAKFCLGKGMTAHNMGIATTASYYDGLVAGPLLGKKNAVLVLTNSKDFSAIDNIYKDKKNDIANVYIFGGTAAVSADAEKHLK